MKEIRKLIRERQRPSATTLPASDLACGVRLLSDVEIDQCKVAAFKYLDGLARERGIDVGRFIDADPEAYDRERTRQILFRAFVAPQSDEDAPTVSLFPSVDVVRDLDAVLVNSMLAVYVDHQEVRATERALDGDAVSRFVNECSDQTMADLMLSQLDARTLRSLVRALVERIRG